jgi:WD40 repeat protein
MLKREKQAGAAVTVPDAKTGWLQTLDAAGPVTAIAFHPTDSRQLLWGTNRVDVQIYDGKVSTVPKIAGPLDNEAVKSVVYAGSGDRFYALYQLGIACRFLKFQPDMPPGPLLYTGKFEAISSSPNGAIVALASVTKNEGKLQFLWADNKDHGLVDTPLGKHDRPVFAMSWPREDLLVTGGEKGEVIFWNAKVGSKERTPKLDVLVTKPEFFSPPKKNVVPLGTIQSLDMTHDGLYLLASDGKNLVVYAGDNIRFSHVTYQGGVAAAALSPVEPIVVWTSGKTLEIKDLGAAQPSPMELLQKLAQGQPPPAWSVRENDGDILSLAVSRDGKRLAIGTSKAKVHILDVGKLVAR